MKIAIFQKSSKEPLRDTINQWLSANSSKEIVFIEQSQSMGDLKKKDIIITISIWYR